jgi:hypothetical protein
VIPNCIFASGLIVLAFAMIVLVRNQSVLHYRLRLINVVFSHRDYEWRRDVFNSVSYERMVFQFWKPLDRFYPDKSFLA